MESPMCPEVFIRPPAESVQTLFSLVDPSPLCGRFGEMCFQNIVNILLVWHKIISYRQITHGSVASCFLIHNCIQIFHIIDFSIVR